ncbi:MAG: alpha/beta hydrolase [Bacteroidota bacterium]
MKNNVTGMILVLLAMSAGLKSNAQTNIPYGDNENAGKYIMLNGVKHYYEMYGSGAPMVLIHGNTTGTKGWAAQIEFFSRKYTVYSIDCRGRGKSDLGKDSLTYMQQTRDINAFIEQLKLDSVCIVGKSDGGIIGIMLGIYFPQHIKKIVAFGANMEPDTNALYPHTVWEMHEERVKADKMLLAKDTTKNWLLVQQCNRMMEFQPHISAADLRSIKVPVLVMSCDRDVIKEEHTFFIYKNIPKANLCILPNEKHQVARLNATLFNTTIDRYLSEPFHGIDFRFK